ncbi:MAG TPA: HD domain-containing phosphohydrolase [Kofleriaceae bacterium]
MAPPRPSTMHRLSHTLAARRAAIGISAVVILILAGFAVWAAQTNKRAVDDVQRLETVSDAYQTARHAVAQENLAARRYQLTPDESHVTQLEQARDSLEAALSTVGRLDEAGDARTAAHIRDQNAQAVADFRTMHALIVANGDITKIIGVSENRMQPLFDSMTATLDRAGRRHRAEALASLHTARNSERVVLVTTAITIILGLLLLTAASAAMMFRERLERIRVREMERLKRAALTDSLTGLGNHRAFEEALARDLSEAREAGQPLSLALLDLDGLKQTNDLHGHQAGDECIRALATTLEQAGPDTAGFRIGGDEFALIARGRRAIDTLYLVQMLQSRMAGATGDRPVHASAGVAEATDGVGRDTLIRHADLALIQTKRSRRRCLLYNEALEPLVVADSRAAETDVMATALARAVDAKDAYGHSHCETVSELCGLIAQELGLRPERAAQLRVAGLLHDVGTLGVPDAIFQKRGALDDHERDMVRSHVRLGHAIVSSANRPIEAEWILHHHERIDGAGYPMGLAGEQIPLESRILLVADAFEAITTDRPHRAARPAEEAVAELEAHAGTQFDAACVAALACVVRGHELREAA